MNRNNSDTRLAEMLAVHERFTEVVLSGGGPSEIVTSLRSLLDCDSAILDNDGRTVAVALTDTERDPDDPELLDGLARDGVRRPIMIGEQVDGTVVALTVDDDLAGVAVERAAMAMAMRQAQARAVAANDDRFAAITLEELISGHVEGTDELVERAASLGWDLQRPRAVLLASIDPPMSAAANGAALATMAAAARATLGAQAIVWTRSATVAALLAPSGTSPVERRTIADGLRVVLDERVRSVTVSIGVGRVVTEPSMLSRSYVEARRAVDVGRWVKGRHVTELFDELGLERLLAATTHDELEDFVAQTIGPLFEHDRERSGSLVETLSVWLETHNVAESARRMHVHYNTIKHRLARIEALLGPVTTVPTRALECDVALHVARHYEFAAPTDS